jgi:hypothetical protein
LMLTLSKGWVAPEMIDAIERTAELAEKSGNLAQLGDLIIRRGFFATTTLPVSHTRGYFRW